MRTLYAFCDLGVVPVSFDIVPAVIQALLAKHEARCERIHFVIVPARQGVDGMFRDKSHLYDAAEMHWRLWNIVVPACRMAGGAVSVVADWAEAKRLPGMGDVRWPGDWDRQTLRNKPYYPGPIVKAAKAGRTIPRLKPLEHARRAVRTQIAKAGKPLVTLTLRDTYEPGRNADPVVWGAMYEALKARFHVVRLLDTAVELKQGVGYGALNLDLRAALYTEALQNFHCHGGPVTLNWFLGAPFVMFGAAYPQKDWAKNWVENIGLAIGEQLPWARADQRLRYDPATAEAMADEARRLDAERAVA